MSRRHRFAVILLLGAALGMIADRPAASQPDPGYWRLADIEAQFAAWETAHPDLVACSVLGASGQKRAILMLTVTNRAVPAADKPRLLFHGAQHANECLGTAAIMAQAAALLAGYGADPQVTARVDNLQLVFVPVLNPDGHAYVFGDHPSWTDWRKNLRDNNDNDEVDFPDDGVDLNRNWDWYWNDCDDSDPESQYYKGPRIFSECEVVALRDWILAQRPLLVLDYHSPATINWTNTIFYPWLSINGGGQAPDYNVARDVAVGWGAATRTLQGSTYSSVPAYDSLPKEQCWVYGRTGILAYVMEIGAQCWYSGADVDSIAARVARGSTYLLDRVLSGPGIYGSVCDAATGVPLAAEVQITQMHSNYVGPRLCDAEHGRYWRLTRSGTFTVRALHPGYETQSQTASVAADWQKVDFALQRIATGVDDDQDAGPGDGASGNELADAASWLCGDRRVCSGQTIHLRLPAESPVAHCELYDLRGRCLGRLGSDLAGGRDQSLRLPGRLASGTYLLRITAGGRQQVARLICVQ